MSDTLSLPLEAVIKEPGYLSEEFIKQREQFFVSLEGRNIYLGCGDDREPTAASAEALARMAPANTLDIRDGYASIYGGLAGIAKNVIVVGVAQYGPEFTETIGGFKGVMDKAVRFSDIAHSESSESTVIMTLHSAANSEDNDVEFNHQATTNLGCAYAAGVGATTVLLTDPTYPLVRDIARADQIRVFGDDNRFDDLIRGHQVFLDEGTEGVAGNFALSRQDYVAAGVPVMILAGRPHIAAKQSGVLSNFVINKVRGSTAANQAGADFYCEDIAKVAAESMKIFAEYNLDPELLMRAFQLDSTPVRAVLASHDQDPRLRGHLDPRNLPMGVLGDPNQALATLRSSR